MRPQHGAQAGEHGLDADTARKAITLADRFADEQLQILESGRYAARRAKEDEVLKLPVDKPMGITGRDVQRAHIMETAAEAHVLLTRMEVDGELAGTDSMPDTGGHIKRTFTKARA